MTHYFRNKAGNKVIGIDADRVTEYDLLFTNDNRAFQTTTVKLDDVSFGKTITRLKAIDTKQKKR